MKITDQLKPTKTHLAFRPLLLERLRATQLAHALELTQPMDVMPVQSITTRALDLLIRNWLRDRSRSLIEVALDVAGAMRALAEWVKFLGQGNKVKLEEYLSSSTSVINATLAIETGLQGYLANGTLTAGDIAAFIVYARQGSGPHYSEPLAAQTLQFFAKVELTPATAMPDLFDKNGRQAAFDIVMLTRLNELCRGVITDKQPVVEVLPNSAHTDIAVRVESAIRVAALLAGVAINAVADFTTHLRHFLLHPWLRQLAKGQSADTIARWAAELQSRKMVLPPAPQWAELSNGNVFDSSFANLFKFDPRSPLLNVNEGTLAWGRPLLNDMTLLADGLPPSALSVIQAMMWEISEGFESTWDAYRKAAGNMGFPLKLVAIDGSALVTADTVTTLSRITSSYDISPAKLTAMTWGPRTDIARVFKNPMSPIRLHTLADYVQRAATSEDVCWLPVLLKGKPDVSLAHPGATPVPHLKVWDEPGSAYPMNKETLIHFMNLTEFEMREMLASWKSATSLDAIEFAERVRHIGIAYFESNGHAEVIPTIDGTWYHSYDYRSFVSFDKAFEIGDAPLATIITTVAPPIDVQQRADVAPVAGMMKHVRIMFAPFHSIPASAVLANMPQNMRQTPLKHVKAHRPVMSWVWTGVEAPEPRVSIKGWNLSAEYIRDIYLVATQVRNELASNLITVTGAEDNDYPLGYYPVNAVITIDGDDAPSKLLASVAPSRRMLLPRPELAPVIMTGPALSPETKS